MIGTLRDEATGLCCGSDKCSWGGSRSISVLGRLVSSEYCGQALTYSYSVKSTRNLEQVAVFAELRKTK